MRIENALRAFGEDLDNPRHQPVPTLRSLVRVGRGAHRDVLALPPGCGELAPQHVGRVHLDHDLRLEVATGVHVQERVRRASEAIDARVGAPSVGIDRPVERHRPAGDAVDDTLRLDLDELGPAELRRVDVTPGDLEELFGHPVTLEHMFDCGKRPGGAPGGVRWRSVPGTGTTGARRAPAASRSSTASLAAHGGNVTFENPASVP